MLGIRIQYFSDSCKHRSSISACIFECSLAFNQRVFAYFQGSRAIHALFCVCVCTGARNNHIYSPVQCVSDTICLNTSSWLSAQLSKAWLKKPEERRILDNFNQTKSSENTTMSALRVYYLNVRKGNIY